MYQNGDKVDLPNGGVVLQGKLTTGEIAKSTAAGKLQIVLKEEAAA